MKIPPPGSDPSGLAEFVDLLVRESEQAPNRIAWVNDAARNYDLYLGDHWISAAPTDQIRLVLNRIQNCIVSLVAVQAGDPPKVTFTPRETGDPPLVYLNTNIPEAQQYAADLAASGVDPAQPLPPEVAQQLKAEVESAEIVRARAAGMGQAPPPNLPPDELIVEITDATTSQALQTMFDAAWEEADAQGVFVENILHKNIFGWQPTLVEFLDDEKRHQLTNVHGFQVFPDPIHADPRRWGYVIYEQPIDANEAKALWPHLADKIDNVADSGNLRWLGSRGHQPAAIYDQQQFQRPMVVVRTAWIRFQPYPMTAEQAIGTGKVEAREVPDVSSQPQQMPLGGGPDAGPEPGGDSSAPQAGGTGDRGAAEPADDGGGVATGPMGAAASSGGAGVLPDPAAPAVQGRTGLFAAGTDTEVAPEHPQWPLLYGIRLIRIVADEAVEDRQHECPELPLPANRNLPIPFSPYAQGEGQRLEGLNMAINRILSAAVTHHAYNAYPPECIPQSVIDAMDASLRNLRSKPGQRIAIPDELIQMFGDVKKLIQTLDVPTLPADFWRLLDLLIQLIDKEGNQSDVMQGNAADSWSGETVKSLQNAASQVIRGKSLYTEFYLKHIARIMVYNLVHRLGPEDWARYVSRYPIQAIAALHDRAKALDVDISVEIASGSGASKAADTQNIVAARQMGVPISDATIMERLNIDPDAEMQRGIESARKASLLAAAAGGAPAVANNPNQNGPPSGAGPGNNGQQANAPAA